MNCYAGSVLARPWFVRSHLWFHLVLSFRRICLCLRFYLILCFGRMYFHFIFSLGFISSLTLDEYTLFHLKAYGHISLRLGFYSSMLIFHSCGFSLNEYTNIKDSNSILENKSYIYLKIQTYVNIRPQVWHMLVSWCLIELKIQTNSSMNSTKV